MISKRLKQAMPFFAVLAALLIMCLMFSWAVISHKSIPLLNGYRCYDVVGNCAFIMLEREDLRDIARIERIGEDSHNGQVGPVDGYRVYQKVIVGHTRNAVGDDPCNGSDSSMPDIPGYFIIDPYEDKIYRGLRKKEWLMRLRAFGVETEPTLYKPTVFDVYQGKNKPS